MEYIVILIFASLVVYLSNTAWMKDFRTRYAALIFFIGYPVFFYFVVLKDFTWFKLSLFLVMLGSSIYSHFKKKTQLEHA